MLSVPCPGDRGSDIQAGRAAEVGRCYLVSSGHPLSEIDVHLGRCSVREHRGLRAGDSQPSREVILSSRGGVKQDGGFSVQVDVFLIGQR